MAGAPPCSAALVHVAPDGTLDRAADDLAFPNGSVITPDGSTLIVGETTGGRYTAFTVGEDGSLTDRRVWAAIEAETAEMEPEEARALLDEFGVHEPGLDGVVHASYRALDLITFLTTGEDETRAWEVRRGAKAPEAAGTIHTDLERGFIRAEVISFDDLVAAGSMEAAKHKGLIRVEGKDYVVQEGDVMHVRFAV